MMEDQNQSRIFGNDQYIFKSNHCIFSLKKENISNSEKHDCSVSSIVMTPIEDWKGNIRLIVKKT
jgi:hypothetical protein